MCKIAAVLHFKCNRDMLEATFLRLVPSACMYDSVTGQFA